MDDTHIRTQDDFTPLERFWSAIKNKLILLLVPRGTYILRVDRKGYIYARMSNAGAAEHGGSLLAAAQAVLRDR
jgi:hypothetical protein